MIQTRPLRKKASQIFHVKQKIPAVKSTLVHSNSRPKLSSKPKVTFENVNCMNIPVKPKSNVSRQFLQKSKSTTKLSQGIPKKNELTTQRGLKVKDVSEGKKLKKSLSKVCLTANEPRKDIQTDRPRGKKRTSMKTEFSSKTPSIYRDQGNPQKSKRILVMKPVIKFKRERQSQLQKLINNSVMYSQVSFKEEKEPYRLQEHCISESIKTETFPVEDQYRMYINFKTNKGFQSLEYERFLENLSQSKDICSASVMIQKMFRGYIVRKYLREAKYIIEKVIKIQRCWKKYKARKMQKNKKNLSISSSLVTIKDLNESIRSERAKFFESKDSSIKKLDLKDIIRSIMEEESLSETIKQKVRQNLMNQDENGKVYLESTKIREHYVQEKIEKQIASERNFNSPRQKESLSTPKNSSKSSHKDQAIWNKSYFFNAMKGDRSSSPSSPNQQVLPCFTVISPRLGYVPQRAILERSPSSSQSHRLKTDQNILRFQEKEVNCFKEGKRQSALEQKGFDTSFQFIEQFCIQIANYFRDEPSEMHRFIGELQQLGFYKINLVLRNWNKFTIYSQENLSDSQVGQLSDFFALQSSQLPNVFSLERREQILAAPNMRIFLEDSHYVDNCHFEMQATYISMIFDCFSEAIFSRYSPNTLCNQYDMNVATIFSGRKLYDTVMAHGLWMIYEWAGTLCGSQFGMDIVEQWMAPVNEQRLDSMVKQITQFGYLGHIQYLILIEVSEIIHQCLLEQMTELLHHQCLLHQMTELLQDLK